MTSSIPTSNIETAILDIAGTATVSTSVIATARSRMNFSIQHLLVAARLGREVARVEADNAGAAFGDFYEVVLGSSVACIILSTAGAEAYINELFADRHECFSSHDQRVLDLLWEQYDQKSILDKFDLAVALRSDQKLDRGHHVVQRFDRLIKLRNGLTHFKPEWFDEQDAHVRISKQIDGFVSRSPWLCNEPLFPRAWATAASVAWAVETIIAFIAHFSAVSGLPDRVQKFASRLSVEIV